jgi:hypothetical protein
MIILTCRVNGGREEEKLLSVRGEVDVDLGLGDFGTWGEAPSADCLLSGGGEQSVAGLYLGGRNLAVGLNGDQQYNLAGDTHAASEFRIGGGDARDDGARGGGECGGGAECEAAEEMKAARGTK